MSRYPPFLYVRLLVEAVLKCPKSRVSEFVKRPSTMGHPRFTIMLARARADASLNDGRHLQKN